MRAYLGSFLGVQQMDLHLTGTNWIADESLLIAEYFCDGRFLDTGEAYANRYVGYWSCAAIASGASASTTTLTRWAFREAV